MVIPPPCFQVGWETRCVWASRGRNGRCEEDRKLRQPKREDKQDNHRR